MVLRVAPEIGRKGSKKQDTDVQESGKRCVVSQFKHFIEKVALQKRAGKGRV